MNRIIYLFLCFFNNSFKVGVYALHFFRPIFVLKSSAQAVLTLIIVYIVFNNFNVDFKAESSIGILKISHYFKVGVRELKERLYFPGLFDKGDQVVFIEQSVVDLEDSVFEIWVDI